MLRLDKEIEEKAIAALKKKGVTVQEASKRKVKNSTTGAEEVKLTPNDVPIAARHITGSAMKNIKGVETVSLTTIDGEHHYVPEEYLK